MEEVDKGCPMIRMSVSGWVFLLVLAYPGSPRPKAVKQLCVCVCVDIKWFLQHCGMFGKMVVSDDSSNLCTDCWQRIGRMKSDDDMFFEETKFSKQIKTNVWVYWDEATIEEISTLYIYYILFLCHTVYATV